MVHQIVAQYTARVGEAVGEARRRGVEEDPSGAERRGADEHQAGVVFAGRLGLRVHDAHAGHAVRGGVVQHGVHDAVGDDGEPSGGLCRRQRGRLAREVRPGRAAALARAAVVTGQTITDALRQDGHAPDGHVPVREHLLDARLHELLASVHLHGGLELAVGQVRQSELFAAHADEALDVAIPRCDVGVADRPVDPVPIAQVCLEVEVAPAVHLAAPDERLAAHLVALNPGERFLLDVRVLAIRHEEMLVRFTELAGARLDRIRLGALRSHREPRVPERELPDRLVLRDVILAVHHVATALDHECPQALFGELLRRPPAGDAGTDHDCVVGDHDHSLPPLGGNGMSPRNRPIGLTRSSRDAPMSDV